MRAVTASSNNEEAAGECAGEAVCRHHNTQHKSDPEATADQKLVRTPHPLLSSCPPSPPKGHPQPHPPYLLYQRRRYGRPGRPAELHPAPVTRDDQSAEGALAAQLVAALGLVGADLELCTQCAAWCGVLVSVLVVGGWCV